MDRTIILSILTPAVPSRMETIGTLQRHIGKQIGDLPVEHLVLLDNKRRSVGEKRDALLRAARGKYVAYVDDDDWIYDGYVSEILKAAEQDPDVITFKQFSSVNGLTAQVEFRLGNPNEPWKPNTLVKRNAWHVCAWRRALAVQSAFPAINYGEDWAFAARLCGIQGLREVHIDKELHAYVHSEKTTEAPAPG